MPRQNLTARQAVAMATMLVAPAAVAILTSPPARADAVSDYVARNGWVVCAVLDDYPSTGGLVGVMEGVMEDSGFNDDQAADVVVQAIYQMCPRHISTLDNAIADYAPGVAI